MSKRPGRASTGGDGAHRLAKLTRPSARGLIERERLFALLDGASDQEEPQSSRVVWAAGPAGSGKTSLAASWLAARKPASLWFQLDEADSDPATFFHYLALAAPTRAHSRPLPALTPEYLLDVPTYARRFFEELFSRLKAPFVAVFDNYHRLAESSPLHALFDVLFETLPAEGAALVLSRRAPPEALARWSADTRFHRIDGEALRFDAAETLQLTRTQGLHDAEKVARLSELTQGWTAGLILMLRAYRQQLLDFNDLERPSQAVFDYFAAEIFAKFDAPVQRFLVKAAIPSSLPVGIARTITGDADSERILNDLHRNQFFTERRGATSETHIYEFHPLFREFLRKRESDLLAASEAREAKQATAKALETDGRIEEAAQLYIELEEWGELTRMVCTHAQAMLGQGRNQTVANWIKQIPEAVRVDMPWLIFWNGMAGLPFQPLLARNDFEVAYQRFLKEGDRIGACLACAGALRSILFAMSSVADADNWADRLQRLVGEESSWLPMDLEAFVIGALGGVVLRDITHPMLDRFARRADELIEKIAAPPLQLELLIFTAHFYVFRGDLEAANRAIARVLPCGRALTGAPTLSIAALTYRAMTNWASGHPKNTYEASEEGLAVAQRTGIHFFSAQLLTQALMAATMEGSLSRAKAGLRAYEAHLGPASPITDRVHLPALRGSVAVLEGQFELARALTDEASRQAAIIESPWFSSLFLITRGTAALLCRDFEPAQRLLLDGIARVRVLRAAFLEFTALIQLAHLHFARDGAEACLPALREALAFGRERNYMTAHPWWLPDVMSKLLGLALEHDIEPDYVRRLIIKRKLAPPEPPPEAWPFVLRIRTLGGFELRVNDAPLTPSRKVPRKALDLLKVVVAMGGKDVTATAVATALWPDADGDAARTSFDTTLHRLRRLLGSDEVLLLEQGKLTLNAAKVWVDAWAFERLEADASSDPARRAERLLALYRGAYLGADEEAPWLLPVRERLRSRFVRSVERLADAMEQSGLTEPVLDLLIRVIEIESVQESLYRRLMRAQLALGRQGEAIATYRRCRHMLSVVLGAAPSRETEGLRAGMGLVG